MSVITFPDALRVSSFRWRFVEQQIVHRGPFGSQAMATGSPVLEVEMSGVPQKWPEAQEAESFLESLKGYENHLALYNMTRPVPLGTMRGAMVLAANAAQGATTLQISAAGEAGKTLLKNDWLGLGSGLTQQVVKIAADATADGMGVITVTTTTPLRNAFTAGAAVTWDRPKALFRQKSLNEGIEYQPVIGSPWALSLREDWR